MFANMVQALAMQRVADRPVLWIGTAGSLCRLDLSEQTWHAYANPGLRDVRALATGAADDELWAASWDGGLHRLKGSVVCSEAPAVPCSIVTLATGPGPDRWAAVALEGPTHLGDPLAFGPHSPPFLVDGVYRNNGQEWSLALPGSKLRASGLPFGERVQTVAQATDGCLWIGTSSGLFFYDTREDVLLMGGGEAGSADARVVLPLADDLLCVGTGRGLLIGQQGALTHVPALEGWPVTALAWDSISGVLWVGMDGGLAMLRADVRGWKVQTWTAEASGMAANHVSALALAWLEPGETQLWIGTPSGLSCYHHRY
jgi:ligand-binding sensor domain-containing protein